MVYIFAQNSKNRTAPGLAFENNSSGRQLICEWRPKKQNAKYSSFARQKNETLKLSDPNMKLRFDWHRNCVTQCLCSWRMNLSDLSPSLLVTWEFDIMNKRHVTGLDGTVSQKRALQIVLFYDDGETCVGDFATCASLSPCFRLFHCTGRAWLSNIGSTDQTSELAQTLKNRRQLQWIDWIDAWNIMFCDREPCFI